MKIVFLNLADMHEHGLAKTAVNSLRKKYPKENWLTELLWNVNRVDLVDLFTLLEEQRNPNLINKRSYGGRWALHGAPAREDHEGKLAEDDIKSSFAYKFFAELVKLSKATIQVTARTGAVSFDSDTGKSLVQTEAAVAADIADADLQKADETKQIADAYNKLQGDMAQAKTIDKFFAIEEAMLKPDAKPVSKR